MCDSGFCVTWCDGTVLSWGFASFVYKFFVFNVLAHTARRSLPRGQNTGRTMRCQGRRTCDERPSRYRTRSGFRTPPLLEASHGGSCFCRGLEESPNDTRPCCDRKQAKGRMGSRDEFSHASEVCAFGDDNPAYRTTALLSQVRKQKCRYQRRPRRFEIDSLPPWLPVWGSRWCRSRWRLQ